MGTSREGNLALARKVSEIVSQYMYRSHRILALIPARDGSTRIRHKNLRMIGGKPLVSYPIRVARASRFVDRVLVTTDSSRIARSARAYGGEVPFLRPARLATATAPVMGAVLHALAWCEREGYHPDIIVLLQATSPFTRTADIDTAIKRLVRSGAPSCVSVAPVVERPEWMFTLQKGRLTPREKLQLRRSQDLPMLYRLNGAIYVTRVSFLRKKKRLFDERRSTAIVMPKERSVDIDDPADLAIAEALFKTIHNR